MSDILVAADTGRLVKKVHFSREGANYGGILYNLAFGLTTTNKFSGSTKTTVTSPMSTGRIAILHWSPEATGVTIYVQASDEKRLTDYLNSLTEDELTPFE